MCQYHQEPFGRRVDWTSKRREKTTRAGKWLWRELAWNHKNKQEADILLTERIILGVDPGTNVMGYGLLKVVGNKATMLAMGVIDMRREHDPYLRLGRIFERITGVIDEYLPDEMAIEAPFFGKNIQSMLKLGRAQGVAIAAAIRHNVPIHEYAPLKIKVALTGQGLASKQQVAGMLQRLLHIKDEDMTPFMDATDALAAAYCHFLQGQVPNTEHSYKGWKDFINKNKERVSGNSESRNRKQEP